MPLASTSIGELFGGCRTPVPSLNPDLELVVFRADRLVDAPNTAILSEHINGQTTVCCCCVVAHQEIAGMVSDLEEICATTSLGTLSS